MKKDVFAEYRLSADERILVELQQTTTILRKRIIWFRPRAIQPDSVRPSIPVTGFAPSSEPHIIYLNVDMTGPRELALVGPKRSLAYGGVLFATVLILGRSCGWRGGREFFDDLPIGAILRPLRSSMALSDADTLSLSRSLSASLPAGATGKGADISREFTAFSSEGGFTIHSADD